MSDPIYGGRWAFTVTRTDIRVYSTRVPVQKNLRFGQRFIRVPDRAYFTRPLLFVFSNALVVEPLENSCRPGRQANTTWAGRLLRRVYRTCRSRCAQRRRRKAGISRSSVSYTRDVNSSSTLRGPGCGAGAAASTSTSARGVSAGGAAGR